MNNVFIGKKERRSIDQLIKRNGKVVVWQWAPGFISDEGISIDNMHQITGMKIDYEKKAGHTHIDITNYQHLARLLVGSTSSVVTKVNLWSKPLRTF